MVYARRLFEPHSGTDTLVSVFAEKVLAKVGMGVAVVL